jgi:hypothetical protein
MNHNATTAIVARDGLRMRADSTGAVALHYNLRKIVGN